MFDENRDRKGDKFEREMADMFNRIGFRTKIHVLIKRGNGQSSEQDVLAEKGNLKILIQCKDYAKFPIENVDEVIQDLIEDGESINVDKLVLAITGHKNLTKLISEAKEKGVYLWDEPFWRKLQSLDMIDLYSEIGKSLEIEEVLRNIRKKEEKDLQEVYENIKTIKDPRRREVIFKELEKISFSDETKKRIQIKKVENEILLEKEREIEDLNRKLEEQNKERAEDIELEEIFKLAGSSILDYHKRYRILEKIKKELSLSQESGRIIDVEKIKTFIEKQQDDSTTENWGDEKYINLEKLKEEGNLSEKDKRLIQEEIRRTIGIGKKGYTESQKIKIGRNIKRAIFKKKMYKTLIAIGILVIISFILWRILF